MGELKRDLGPSSVAAGNLAPSEDRWFIEAMANEILRERMEAEERPMSVEGARWRASWSGKCSRATAFAMAGVPKSNPPDLASHWVFYLGQLVHDAVDRVVARQFPGAEVEVGAPVDLGESLLRGAATADVLLTFKGERILVEVKTTGGFSFKMQATDFKGPPEGPRTSALRQAAVNALANDCDRMVVAVFALENVSASMAERSGMDALDRFAAQWDLSREEFEPIARSEMDRVTAIAGRLDQLAGESGDWSEVAHLVKPKVILDDQRQVLVTKPGDGTWVEFGAAETIIDSGSTWECGYCDWRDTCVARS